LSKVPWKIPLLLIALVILNASHTMVLSTHHSLEEWEFLSFEDLLRYPVLDRTRLKTEEELREEWDEKHEEWEKEAVVVPYKKLSKDVTEEMRKEGLRRKGALLSSREYLREKVRRYREKVQEALGDCDEECEWVTAKHCRIVIGKSSPEWVFFPRTVKVELLPYGTDTFSEYDEYKRMEIIIQEISEDLDTLIFLADTLSALSKGRIGRIGTPQAGDVKEVIMNSANLYFSTFKTSVWATYEFEVEAWYRRYHCGDYDECKLHEEYELCWDVKMWWAYRTRVKYQCYIVDVIGGTAKSRLIRAMSNVKAVKKLLMSELYDELNVKNDGEYCKKGVFPKYLRNDELYCRKVTE